MGDNRRFEGSRLSASDPAVDGLEFTGTADVTLPICSRGVYIGTAGTLKVDMRGMDGAAGATITFTGLLAGAQYPFAFIKIYDVGTTAAGVVLY